MRKLINGFMFGAVAMFLACGTAFAEGLLKPYVFAYPTNDSLEAAATEAKSKVTAAGFQVVGEYRPHSNAIVVAITSDELKAAAKKSEAGGYGAVQRVTITKPFSPGDDDTIITKQNEPVQVSYTNPVYLQNAYRMNADLSGVKAKLASALGAIEEFGSYNKYADGISADDLRGYHYTVMMEYFDDPSELAEYDSYEEAVAGVEAALASGAGGTSKVYRVDIPGKKETVFGVKLTEDCSGDATIMSRIDHGPYHHSGHLPYEILVSEDTAYALYARFRIAISFLGLPMMASETGATFLSIMCAPDAIEEALIVAAGGEL